MFDVADVLDVAVDNTYFFFVSSALVLASIDFDIDVDVADVGSSVLVIAAFDVDVADVLLGPLSSS